MVLHIKDDQREFLDESRLKNIIKVHSQYISYPISLLCEKEREVEVKDTEEKEDTVEGEVEEVEQGDNLKKVKETYTEYEQLNKTKPLWTYPPDSVSNEDYSQFYKSLTSDWDEPLAHKHFCVEGQLEFR